MLQFCCTQERTDRLLVHVVADGYASGTIEWLLLQPCSGGSRCRTGEIEAPDLSGTVYKTAQACRQKFDTWKDLRSANASEDGGR